MKKIGLIINPIAGIGGKVGLKGSDGIEIQQKAFNLNAKREANEKTRLALDELKNKKNEILFLTAPQNMGANLLDKMGFNYEVVGNTNEQTTPEDTERIAKEMQEKGIDLLLFAGGDGTARNIYNAIKNTTPAIGVPAGVKIHSAVFANTPKAAGEIVSHYIEDMENIELVDCEVMDLDEEKYREGIVQAELYGYLRVPYMKDLVQNPKSPADFNKFDTEGIADEIAYFLRSGDKETYYIFSTGGTTYRLMEQLGFEGSLLGVDVIYKNKVILTDTTEEELYEKIKGEKCKLFVSIIGGQGHIFGRGNHQLSPRVIREIGKENIIVVASMDKINSLHGNPIHVDTSDEELDEELSGYTRVLIGSKEYYMYKISK